MKELLPYLQTYIKINHFTVQFFLILISLSLLKYLPFRFSIPKKWIFLLVLFVGLLFRIAWLNTSMYEPKFSFSPDQSETEFDLIHIHAIELTKGIWFKDSEGNPTARRPIGYPMFIGLLYKIFGIHLSILWVTHLILFIITLFLIFKISELLFSTRVGLGAMFLLSIHPISIFSVRLVTDEHLFLPVFYLGLYLLFKDLKNGSLQLGKWNWFWYGLLFGYATMTRTHSIFMPVVIAIGYFLSKRPLKQTAAVFCGTLFIMQLLNLPWVIRNYQAWGVPVLYSTNSKFIYNLVNSSAIPEKAGAIPKRGEIGFSEELERAMLTKNEGRVHSLSNVEMTKWILNHPKAFLKLGIARMLLFMNWQKRGVWPLLSQYKEDSKGRVGHISKKMDYLFRESAYLFYYVILYCFIFSLLLAISQRKKMGLARQVQWLTLMAIFLFWCAEHMFLGAEKKYRFPLEPLMIICASYFLDYLLFTFRYPYAKHLLTAKNDSV